MTDIETKNERRSRASRVDVILITSVGCRGSCASPRRFFRVTLAVARGRGSPPDGSSGHDGRFARSSSRVARRLQRDAGEGRLRALAAREELRRFLAHLPQRALHARARARASRLARDGGGPGQGRALARRSRSRGGGRGAPSARIPRVDRDAGELPQPRRISPRVPRPRRAPPPPLQRHLRATVRVPRRRPRRPRRPRRRRPRRRPRGRVRAPPPQPRRARRRRRRASRRRRRRRRRRTPRAIRARKSHRLHRLPRRPRRRRLGAPRGTLPPVV